MHSENMMVSVYCLAFNQEAYIRSALDGFVSQKANFPFEVFVHDDASTDGTADIIREYAQKYPHIIKPIFQTQNQYSQGVRIMRTHILPRMTGKYIASCEGDDYWCDENKLQMQVDFLEAHPDYSACVHNARRIYMKNGSETVMFGKEAYTITPEHTIPKGAAAYQTASLMYRRELALEQPAFVTSVKGVGDYPLAIYLSMMGKIRYFPAVMSVYRANAVGSWTETVSRNPERIVKVREAILQMLKMADAYSGGQYHDAFSRAQGLYEYNILRAKGAYWAAVKHPHFREEPRKAQLMLLTQACFPRLTEWAKKKLR